MTRPETIRAIRELADLMVEFENDSDELVNLIARTRIRLNHLEGHAIAGRPDLQAKLRRGGLEPVA